MTDLCVLLAEVIATAGGRVIGRVRLQKTFYLLEQLGLSGGLHYEYHHYGPYSSELASAVADATAFKLIHENIERRIDGVGYSVYSTSHAHSAKIGSIDADIGRSALSIMQNSSSTILELAATIHWLSEVEKISDWRTELWRRKGVKTEAGRADKALALLKQLGLCPSLV